jgi:hypothetical protein
VKFNSAPDGDLNLRFFMLAYHFIPFERLFSP